MAKPGIPPPPPGFEDIDQAPPPPEGFEEVSSAPAMQMVPAHTPFQRTPRVEPENQITALKPGEFEDIQAKAERAGTPLEKAEGRGGAWATAPRRLAKAAGVGFSKAIVGVASVPQGLLRLQALPAYALGATKIGDAINHVADILTPTSAQKTLEAEAPKTTEGKVIQLGAQFAGDVMALGGGAKALSRAGQVPTWAIPSIFAAQGAAGAATQAHANGQDVAHPVKTALGATTEAGLSYLSGLAMGKMMPIGEFKSPSLTAATQAAGGAAFGATTRAAQNVVAKATYDPERSLTDGMLEQALMFSAGSLAHTMSQTANLRKGMLEHPQGPEGFMSDMRVAMDNADAALRDGTMKPVTHKAIKRAFDRSQSIFTDLMGKAEGQSAQAGAAPPSAFPIVKKLLPEYKGEPTEAPNALQVASPAPEVPRDGTVGGDIVSGSQEVGQGIEGQASPGEGQAQAQVQQAITLPKELAGAKPRYNYGSKGFTPQFESDVDKALFIVAQAKPSAKDAAYIEWLKEQFPGESEASIRARGREVRDEIKALARAQDKSGSLAVPDQGHIPVEAPPEMPLPEDVAAPEMPPAQAMDGTAKERVSPRKALNLTLAFVEKKQEEDPAWGATSKGDPDRVAARYVDKYFTEMPQDLQNFWLNRAAKDFETGATHRVGIEDEFSDGQVHGAHIFDLKEEASSAPSDEPVAVPQNPLFPEMLGQDVPQRRAEDISGAPAPTARERRADASLRKRVDEMTPEERTSALHTDDLTGMNNARWWKDHESRGTIGKYQALADGDSVKWVNDNIGHQAGDELLSVFADAFEHAGLSDRAARVGGDEFKMFGDNAKELESSIQKAHSYMKEHPFKAKLADGEVIEFTGGFSHGIGENAEMAEAAQSAHKAERSARGERAERGNEPPGIRRTKPGLPVDRDREEAVPQPEGQKEPVGEEVTNRQEAKAKQEREAKTIDPTPSGEVPETLSDIPGINASGTVFNMPTAELSTDPATFQFKVQNEATGVQQVGKRGATGSISPDVKYDRSLAQAIHVWRDPATGKVFVVNGHNRYEKAMNEGIPDMDVRFLDAKDAREAMTQGAVLNLAEGHGTALDAAVFFRNTKATLEDLQSRGVSPSKKVVQDGFALASLPDTWFYAAANDPEILRLAVETGKAKLNTNQNETGFRELHSLLTKRDGDPSRITTTFWKDMVDRIKASSSMKTGETSLFGEEETTSTLPEQTELIQHIQSALNADRRIGADLTSKALADARKKAGITEETEKTGRGLKAEASLAGAYFKAQKHFADIGRIINEYAAELNQARSDKERAGIKAAALDAARSQIRSDLAGTAGEGAGGAGDGQLGLSEEVTPRQEMKAKVQDAVPNSGIDDPMAKAIRAETYRSGDVTDESTPAEVEQATGEAWTRTMTNRKSELGAINLGDVADAMQGIVKKLYPEAKPDKPPTHEQILQKERELAKKRAIPIDLNKVDLNKGVNSTLAYWVTLAGGGGVDANGIPIVGGPIFPSDAPALPSRDATKFETFMSRIDNPAAIMEGGIDSFQSILFELGQSPVAEAAFANIRKGTLKLNLTEWKNNLLANTVNCTREVESAIKPIFERYGILRGQQKPLQDQIQPALRYRAKEASLQIETDFVEKLKREQINDIEPRPGVVGQREIDAWQKRTKDRAERIKKAEARAKKSQEQMDQIVEEDQKGKNVLNDPRTPERMKRHDEIEAKLETERGNLDKATEELGRKYSRVRVAVAASLGAEKQNYPDWLKAAMNDHDQKIAEGLRKFFDDSALPALENLKVPVRKNENFLHQPNRRYLSGGETTWAGVPERPQNYREPQFDPTSIHFAHAEDNALLWYPDAGGILDSYIDVFSGIVSKRELANRWEPAIEEMRAQGQLKAASMSEKFLNDYAHGAKRNHALDSITAWFYYKNLALNPSPALLHASKQLLNPTALGGAATAKAYRDAARMVTSNSEEARLMRKATRTWRASQGAKSIMEVESGIEPTARMKMLRDAYGFSASSPIGQVELVDRNVTFLGSLELAKQMGLPDDRAIQVAMGTTMAINFLGVDRAPIYRGSIGNAVFAFMGAPTKLMDFGRRQANNTIRGIIAGAKPDPVTGKRGGFSRKKGSIGPGPGKAGEHYRNLQRTAIYATTIVMAGLVDDYFNTHKIQSGLIHMPKMYRLVLAMLKGDKEGIYGGTADLAPAVTQFMDDLDKYGWGMPLMMNAVLPTVANKAWIGWYNDGAPAKGQQWGEDVFERSARYLLNAPKADVTGEVKERRGFKKEKMQENKSRQWMREHGME